jgi:hypothetical protein
MCLLATLKDTESPEHGPSEAGYTESLVEEATLSWLSDLDYSVAHGPDLALDEPASLVLDYLNDRDSQCVILCVT